jgi:hypothetical protein
MLPQRSLPLPLFQAAALYAEQHTAANVTKYADTQQLLGECRDRANDLTRHKMLETVKARRAA